jgi:Domain of unknown function (DUF4326)
VTTKKLVVHCKKENVYIARPSPWGNPFSHLPNTLAEYRVNTREEAIAEYEKWLRARPILVARAQRELRGLVLGCWCSPKPCHGDVLVKISNEDDI